MKKLTAIIITFLICFSLFAYDGKVCVYPSNNEIKGYITKYFNLKTSDAKVSIPFETILTEDFRLLEYLCKVSGADFLIFPRESDLAGLNYYQIFVYDRAENNFELCYEHISQESGFFTEMAVYALQPYLSEKEIVIQPKEEKKDTEEKVYGFNLSITSNPQAQIWIDGVMVGTTPFELESYRIPTVLRLTAEGYSDSLCYVNKETESINVNLTLLENKDKSLYKDARSTFYKAFGINLLTFGLKAAIPSFISPESAAYKYVDYAADGVIAVFAVNTAICLINYFRSAQKVSP